ncbi:MAG: ornithine cyclodeaminase family protein [Armatimonadota bacterium]|nr:ornithine cyclodeaminase family protein [Armatimonadota bacterium]MDR7486394.1 ornithine cyclodeaminase family protein [Armatimonadota bacterium]MDR7532526.1 ornithine cyclodeaminase family protein [Armatimonadota bacterium]MDR7535584.1 ornithine cyclodeaminase family protein [Armatimonadota bacterium]
MARWLQEADVERLLAIDDVIAAVEQGFRWLGEGAAVNQPRTRAITPQGVLHVMHAAVPPLGVAGVKAYATTPRGARFVALLYRLDDGELLLMTEADRLGQLRTGAASGVATKFLARPDAGALGVIGSGWQARSQVQAVARVRPVALVKVYSRTPERRHAFAEEIVAALGVEAVAVESAQEAVAGVDVIVTITSARDPVLGGAWLSPGVHINAAGANAATRAELDAEAVRRSQLIAVDALDQARVECGDLLAAERAGDPVWSRVVELGAIVAGRAPGRARPDQITLFESQGIAMEDVVALELLYRRAVAAGAGQEIPTSREASRARR